MADEKPVVEQANGNGADGQPPVEEKKKRGKPKDEHAPPKPKNPYSKFAGECRARLKEEKPELVADLSAMGKAIAEEWMKVSDADKAKSQAEYEKEMVVWKPLWAEYKQTTHYKEFVEVKTDWLDKRAQKKLFKTMNKDAPKRPKSGYMIFAGTIREEVMETVREKGLGLGDAGKMISDRWNALTEGQKGEYGERSQRQKIAFDKDFAVYKKTEAFGTFCDAKAKLEGTQQLKKLVRTHLDEAPKRPPSGYAMFRNEVMPGICKENEGKEGDAKLSMGDMGKKVAAMWVEVPEGKKAEYSEAAGKLKEQYDKDFKAFKANQKYTAFLEKRQKVKARENLLVHCREMPKRPKSVFAMFSADHKDEVTPGKGEGKGTHALKTLFQAAPKEEKVKYEEKNEELTEQWKKDVVDFKAGPKYATFLNTKKKIELEFKNEAIKVSTFKFLDDAPAGPAKTAFAVFVGEKRKAAGEPEGGARKTKEQKRDEVVKAKDEWMKLDKAVRDGFEDKRKDLLKAYEETVRQFMAGEKWQEYQKEAKRLRIPIKSLLYHKKMIIKKTKDGKVAPASVPLPAKPDLWPSRPQNAIQIFTAEKKQTVDSVAEIHEMWKNLRPEDKAPFDEQAAQQAKKFAADMQEFKRSDEGKKYTRDLAAAQRRRRTIAARNMYLDDLPKKPTSAIYEWMKKNMKNVKKENPEAKGFDLKKKLTDTWNALTDEEKEPFNKAATEKMEEFNSSMKAFKESDNWKKYVNATKVRKFGGAAKGGGGGGPSAPANMPKKPATAFMAFVQEQAKAGKGGPLAEMQKQFGTLEPEEKKKYLEEAQERASQFRQDMAEFEKSVAGKRYRAMSASFAKRKRLNDLKARFLKDEPAKPKAALSIFFAENRAQVTADNPELKGIGPVQTKLSQMWKALTDDERQVWKDKEKEENEAYQQKMQEFQETDNYKKYRKFSNALTGMGKAKAKKGPVLIAMPKKPENLPKAPKNGFFLFSDEQRSSGGPKDLKGINKLWLELGAEGQKKYTEQANEMKRTYDADMIEFQKSMEGKKYLREKAVAEKKQRLATAKQRFLGGADQPKEPKRPASAYFIFLAEKASTHSDKSQKEKATELTAQWGALPPEEKKVYEDKAKERKATYDEQMKAYKESKGYKDYAKMLGQVSGTAQKQKVLAVKAAKEKMGAGRGRGAAAKGRGRGARPAVVAKSGNDSGSDQMGSDSSSKSKKSKSSSSSKKSSSSSSKSKSSASD